jgi:hypothetical protein
MSEKSMQSKKGKNFKEIIEEEKQKGKTTKKIMHALTSLDVSVLYGGSFLVCFVALAAVFYFALSPAVFVWAGLLLVAALVSTFLASRFAKLVKRLQWRYSD